MKKTTAIRMLGGTEVAAAQAIGCTKQAIQLWETDEYDNLKSKRACDAVLAAIVRKNYGQRIAFPDQDRIHVDELTLEDLLTPAVALGQGD